MGQQKFRFGDIELSYNDIHFVGLKEIYLLDIYRKSLLKAGDIVLDLGAGIGDFTVLASRRVGPSGKVIAIEPNREDYELLELNIKHNHCLNVTPLNLGVGGTAGKSEITFWGRTYSFDIRTIEDILHSVNADHADFIKMDIEGFEKDVIKASMKTIARSRVISIELHDTKDIIDKILIPSGYSFYPITMGYVYRNALTTLFSNPTLFWKALADSLFREPDMIIRAIKGFNMTKSHLMVGSYVARQPITEFQ